MGELENKIRRVCEGYCPAKNTHLEEIIKIVNDFKQDFPCLRPIEELSCANNCYTIADDYLKVRLFLKKWLGE